MRRTLLLVAVALLAACGKTTSRPAASFRGMSAVALFRGHLHEHPGELRTYVACANPIGDELKFVDALDDRVVLAPAPVGPLSLPTQPRPTFLASSPLYDRDGSDQPDAKPDLLVVASLGPQPLASGGTSVQLQLVVTWEPETHLAREVVDLGVVAAEGELVALLATPVPRAATLGLEPTPGRARVYAALTGGRLVTVEFERKSDGSIGPVGAPVVQALGFELAALAAIDSGGLLYVASPDPLPGGVLGVAELDATGAPGGFTVRALDAHGPTLAVTALRVREFTGFKSRVTPGTTDFEPRIDAFAAVATLRVYAALAPWACGRDARMPCGVVVIDPAAGTLLADPAGEEPFMLPIQVPGSVTSLTATEPSAVQEALDSTLAPLSDGPVLRIAPGSGQRYTTGLIAAASTLGKTYLIDPAHFAIPNDIDMLRGDETRVRVTAASTGQPNQLDGSSQPLGKAYIGVWDDRVKNAEAVTLTTSTIVDVIGVTPGFTGSESWSVTWRGILPGLQARRGELLPESPVSNLLAIQVRTGLPDSNGLVAFRDVGRLYDPALFVHLGDSVIVDATSEVAACAQDTATGLGGTYEMVVAGFRPPTASFPGGALELTPASVQPDNAVFDASGRLVLNPDGTVKTTKGNPACADGLAGPAKVVTSVRAAGFVLAGALTGYAGRPDVVPSTPQDINPFELRHEPEAPLSCPILAETDLDWPPSSAAVAACEANQATCRDQCERVLLSRRTRRSYYLTDRCLGGTSSVQVSCAEAWDTGFDPPIPSRPNLDFPFPRGPVLSFKLGLLKKNASTGELEAATTSDLVRDTFLSFATASGFSPAARVPLEGSASRLAAQPTATAWFDRAAATRNAGDSIHGFVGFGAGALVDFHAGDSGPNAITLR